LEHSAPPTPLPSPAPGGPPGRPVPPGGPGQASVGDILAGVESGPRQRYLELAQTLGAWPEVEASTYRHVGEWSPVFSLHGRQVLHVHFHKPHLISASLAIPGRLGEAARAAPGLTPRLRQRIDHEWRAAETFVEYRINTDDDRRAVEAAARAIYDALATLAPPPPPAAPAGLP
jgi:hypothetical protein